MRTKWLWAIFEFIPLRPERKVMNKLASRCGKA